MLYINVYDPNVGNWSWFHIWRGDYGIMTLWSFQPNCLKICFFVDTRVWKKNTKKCQELESEARSGGLVENNSFPGFPPAFSSFTIQLLPLGLQLRPRWQKVRVSWVDKKPIPQVFLKKLHPQSNPKRTYCIPLPTVFFEKRDREHLIFHDVL